MNIAILGSTGSIGTNTLDVVSRHPDRYRVTALGAGKNLEKLAEQIRYFCPAVVSIAEGDDVEILRSMIGTGVPQPDIIFGEQGMCSLAADTDSDLVVSAIAGAAGMMPTLSAVRAHKDVALANKEALVMAGEVLMHDSGQNGCRIIPVDSEHSAIFQLMQNNTPQSALKRIILTASGGPFLHKTNEDIAMAEPADALNHPRWEMGNKVTIDSASLMNKGLEVIEAHWLFGLSADQIDVVIHQESIIHSMIEYVDGTILAQLSQPDMRGPIAYALSCPERLPDIMGGLDLIKTGALTFKEPDGNRFPNLGLAYGALHEGGLMPAVLNAANEIAVEKFCEKALPFNKMPVLIEKVMERFDNNLEVTVENILGADEWARNESHNVLNEFF